MKHSSFFKIGLALFFLLILFLSLIFIMRKKDSPTPNDTSNPDTVLPVLDDDTLRTNPVKNNGGGSSVINRPETVNLGSGNYIVAGGNDLYEEPSFQILFYEPDQSYTVSLLKAPLGSARRNAEVALFKLINVSVSDACALPIMVTVPFSVDASMSGRDLGLSFCNGAVPLP